MASLQNPIKKGPQQTEPVVFLWAFRRPGVVHKMVTIPSAKFAAFGKQWHLEWVEYPKDAKTEFGAFLRPKVPDKEETRFDIFIRNEASGPDILRQRLLKVIEVSWGGRFSRDINRWRDVEESIVVGVAIYPPKTPLVRRVFVPPQTVSSSFLYQAGNADPCLFTHQVPIFEYDTFWRLHVDPKHSDIKFIVEEQELRAHTSVLQSERAGPYFVGLLAHPFKESIDRKIRITEIPCRIFKAILEFIYTGRTVVDSAEDLFELYRAADRFQITALLPFIKGELLLSLTARDADPNHFLNLIPQLKHFPDLREGVRICVRRVFDKWSDINASQDWRAIVGDSGAVEAFLDEGAELYKKFKT
ncbi:hypothetical protein HK104_000624 [Borealophlyctis nickersoniae]|nr:hypothetical protein HK104_000624 [Borealophlyctis nickersoniae]